jgi:GNAT superfamily N-acetyltransferase
VSAHTPSTLVPGDTIRPARAEDVALLAAIERAAAVRFADTGLRSDVLDGTVDAHELDEAVRQGRLWIAEHDDRPVGFALARVLDDGEPWLEELDVLPAHGRRGLGRALVDAVIAWARDGGARSLALATFRDLPWNAPFYATIGFGELPAAEHSPAHRRLIAAETAKGLPANRRVLMRLRLVPPPPAA